MTPLTTANLLNQPEPWTLAGLDGLVQSLRAEFPGTRASLSRIRKMAEDVTADASLDELAITAFQMAVDEISSNVVEHGYEKSCAGEVPVLVIEMGRFEDRIEAIVTDTSAIPFSLEMPGSTPQQLFAQEQDRGLGLDIVRHCVDKIEHQWLPPQGNQTRLTKYFPEA